MWWNTNNPQKSVDTIPGYRDDDPIPRLKSEVDKIQSATKAIPTQTFKRLPGYFSLLAKLDAQGLENVSSTTIAGILKLNDVVVRKDLAAVSENAGRPRTGYAVHDLLRSIGICLGYHQTHEAVLVGVGQLGRALLSYEGFEKYGVRIVAAFDVDPEIIGTERKGKPVLPLSELGEFCKNGDIRTGIITVPEREAQGVCDGLVSGGVLSIWNFAPTHLKAPENVFVQNENMALSLSLLLQHLSQNDRK